MVRTLLYSGAEVITALAGQSAAQAAQIVLNASSVIGSTGGFNASFTPGAIVNQQTGEVVERFGDGSTWLNPDGRDPAFITLDLCAALQLGNFDPFNLSNLGDRATGGSKFLLPIRSRPRWAHPHGSPAVSNAFRHTVSLDLKSSQTDGVRIRGQPGRLFGGAAN